MNPEMLQALLSAHGALGGLFGRSASQAAQPYMSQIPGSAGGALGGLFGRSASQAAQPYMSQIPGYVHKYMDPFAQEGIRDLPALHEQFARLIGDPSAFIKREEAGYQASPQFQMESQAATQAAQRAAAAGGQAGSPAEQVALAQRIQGMAGSDLGRYMQQVMGAYHTGLAGLGGLERQGFGAAGQAMNELGQYAQNQAMLAALSQQHRNQMMGNIFGQLGAVPGAIASFGEL